MQTSKQVARALPPGHGNTIYAYCNVRTNQVLYSLERTLRQSHLSQLADVGANNNPPKIRKDLWRPLFVVSVPEQQQGLELFRKLREYRILHETNWELTEAIKRPYTEKQIEEMKQKLDDRGGSKKENVFDIIKRKKKKLRVQVIMDQKANSVADLAAILLRQEESSASLAAKQEQLRQERKTQVLREIVRLAQRVESEGVDGIDKQIADLKAELGDAIRKSQDKSQPVKQRKEEFRKAQTLSEARKRAVIQKRKAEWAVKTVKKAKARAAAEIAYREAVAAGKRPAEDQQPATETQEPTEVDYRLFIEPYPVSLDPIRAVFEGHAFSKRGALYRAHKHHVKLVQRSIFSTKGVSIKWANPLDAEYAEIWPGDVKFENMGVVRNTAPEPDSEAIDSISDFKAQQWKTRPANWDAAQSEDIDEVVEAADPVAEGDSVVEAEVAEVKEEEDRQAVLAEIKNQILEDVKFKAGRPAWKWSRELVKRQKRERLRQAAIPTQSTPSSGTNIGLQPPEPTSAETAPKL